MAKTRKARHSPSSPQDKSEKEAPHYISSYFHRPGTQQSTNLCDTRGKWKAEKWKRKAQVESPRGGWGRMESSLRWKAPDCREGKVGQYILLQRRYPLKVGFTFRLFTYISILPCILGSTQTTVYSLLQAFRIVDALSRVKAGSHSCLYV